MLYLLHNKSIKFDTRVKYLQRYFIEIYKSYEYVQIVKTSNFMLVDIILQNIKWCALAIKIKCNKSEDSIAYLPDLISVIKALPYVILGGKFIFDIHDYEHDRAPNGRRLSATYLIRMVILRYAIKKSCALLTVSNLMKRYFCNYYNANPASTFVFFNNFLEINCSCEFSSDVSELRSNENTLRIGIVGKKSVSRGSTEMVEYLISDLIKKKLITGKIEFIWIGSDSADVRANLHSQSSRLSVINTELPLLCQYCLHKAVSKCDVVIHAYKPNFANARHAVPNKLFTFLNSANGLVIFSGDYECKKILLNSFDKDRIKWISSRRSWKDTLSIISGNIDIFATIDKNRHKFTENESTTRSFINYNYIEFERLRKLLNV